MHDNELIALINNAAEALELDGSVIEKDYYATQIIHALSKIENEYFRLVFAGGTCLAKAYKIVKRMSEDVDFKIQLKNDGKFFSKNRILKELKQLRLLIISKLKIYKLNVGLPTVRNEGQYFRIEINYPSVFPINTRLRSHILLEFTLSNIQLLINDLSTKTMIEDALENITIFTPPLTPCVSIAETAIEKWVGLTRRIIAIERKYHYDDATLIRHVYDLVSIKQANKINSDFFTLAKAVINNDAALFKNQHPEYFSNPSNEIRQSITLLKNKPVWKLRYQEFIESMVYDNIASHQYENAINILETISHEIIITLH